MEEYKLKRFSFGWKKYAGLVCVRIRDGFYVHFGIQKDLWTWGIERDWYDGPLIDIGLGPFILVSLMWGCADKVIRVLEKLHLAWIVDDVNRQE